MRDLCVVLSYIVMHMGGGRDNNRDMDMLSSRDNNRDMDMVSRGNNHRSMDMVSRAERTAKGRSGTSLI